jgi:hypothetical protein
MGLGADEHPVSGLSKQREGKKRKRKKRKRKHPVISNHDGIKA